jgi:hypothetical protein
MSEWHNIYERAVRYAEGKGEPPTRDDVSRMLARLDHLDNIAGRLANVARRAREARATR